MYERFPELVDAFRRGLVFAGLKPEHTVVLLASTSGFEPIVDAAHTAATSMGTHPLLLVVSHRQPRTDLPEIAEAAVIAADFFVDLMHLSYYYTPSSQRIMAARRKKNGPGVVFHSSEEDVETNIRNAPTPQKLERATRARALIDAAKWIRVTTREGTDLRMSRGDPRDAPSHPAGPYGYGMVTFSPPTGTTEGTIQCVGGLRIMFPFPERLAVRQSLRLELKAGRVARVDRGTPEGAYLDDWFRSFGREDALDYSHVCLGLERLSIRHLDNQALHFAYGGVCSGFGTRGLGALGGPLSDAPNHMDLHMANASFYVDEVAILQDGKFTPASGLTFDPGEPND